MGWRRDAVIAVAAGIAVNWIIASLCSLNPYPQTFQMSWSGGQAVPAGVRLHEPPEWLVKRDNSALRPGVSNTYIATRYSEDRSTGVTFTTFTADEFMRSDNWPVPAKALVRFQSGWPLPSFECVVRSARGEP